MASWFLIMEFLNEMLHPADAAGSDWTRQLALALLVAYIVGQLNAWCYRWTHAGVSYSRTFTQALVLIPIIAALSMSLVAIRALVAIGLLGGAAIIRFRTAVRDARDTAYVFLSLICGMGAGFGFLSSVIIGALLANAVAIVLYAGRFGAWHSGDSFLHFEINAGDIDSARLTTILARFCRRVKVISVDEAPTTEPDSAARCECAYKIRLRNPDLAPDLVSELKGIFGLSSVHLLVERENEEVI